MHVMEEKVLEILRRLGFRPGKADEAPVYDFEYEGLNVLMAPQADSQTLVIMLPGVYTVTEDNRVEVLELMAKLTRMLKFIQPTIYDDSLWINYQHYLGEKEPDEDLVEHMIRVIGVAAKEFIKAVKHEDNEV